MTVTCDGRWVVYAVDKNDTDLTEEERKNIGPFAIYKINTQNGEEDLWRIC